MKTMDVVIPYKKTNSKELIYMIRSLENLPHGEIYITGDEAPLTGVTQIPFSQVYDVATNTLGILDFACQQADISSDFIWMSDDIFVMEKISELPVSHRGEYAGICKEYRLANNQTYYTRRMERTRDRLIDLGIEKPLCYELHMPFVINKRKWNNIRMEINNKLNKLSMYGNLNRIGGTMVEDCKTRSLKLIPEGPFISTFDDVFERGAAGQLIREKFNRRSPYEI